MKNVRLLLLFSLVLPASFSAAQEFTGRVSDTTGAVIPKATVVAHNLDTGVDTPTQTTATGDYTIPYLIPGNYAVSVRAPGFETVVHAGIVLQLAQTSTVNFALKVGQATATVTVNADTLLDIGKADTGEDIETTRVTELPLDGGDPSMLTALTAGVIWTGSLQWQRPFDDTQMNTSINGGQAGYIALMMDGVANSSSPINNVGQSLISYVPPVDTVQEFKIITNPYDAQYGLMAGGVEDVKLKSGTNQLHGTVYDNARRTFLDANTWSDDWYIGTATPGTNLAPYATPQMSWNQYGAELDGPIVLPKIYNGRDKSFFTLAYEKFGEIQPGTLTTSVPQTGWATGNFTNLTYWNSSDSAYEPVSLLDPENISQNANGAWVRVPFGPTDTINPTSAPNIIPASRINPMAQTIIKMFPAPNTTIAPEGTSYSDNYTIPDPEIESYRNVLAKWDYNFSPRDRFSLHYGYWERVEEVNENGLSGPLESGHVPYGERSNTFTLEETHTVTPILLLDFRASAGVRTDYTISAPVYDPTALGWSASETAAMGTAAAAEFPYLQLSEFAYPGTTGNGQTELNSLAVLPAMTWIKNKHTIRAGLDMRFWQSDNNIIGGGNNFWIDRTWTQTECGSCGSWDPASGNSIASLLLGNPTSGSDSINVKTFWSAHYWAPFVQDDWKLTRKLTLNIGVRWDFVEPETERHNFGNGGFDSTAINPISSMVSVPGYSQILGGVTFLGVNGYARSAYPLTKTDIQPRFGIAYALNDKTVLRAGLGESTRSPENAPNNIGYSATTSYLANDPNYPGSVYPNLANPISNPYSSVVLPTGNSQGLLTDLGQGPWTINPHYIIPTFWNYSVGVERQLSGHDKVTIQYVGSRLYNGDCDNESSYGGCPNINNYSAAGLADMTPCNPENGGRYETCANNNVPNPFYGISAFNGSSFYSDTTINFLDLTVPFPEFGAMTMWQSNTSRTWYNSLQTTFEHRLNHGLVLHGTWTYSKLMDAGGWNDSTFLVPFREIDPNDMSHRITLSGVYNIPVGHGRTFLSNSNRIVDGAIGGWELGSLYIYQSGTPWLLPGNPNEVYLHSAYVQPHIQKDDGYIRLVAACAEQYQENQSTGVYSLVQLSQYSYDGTCSQGADFLQVPNYAPHPDNVYTGIRLPRSHQFDADLSKNFAIRENLHLQIRGSAFNVLNHPLWCENPDGSTNDSTFGMILRGPWGQSNLPRQMQLSAKFIW
jgi:Carboxypeptidase regulatory-like domain/TonB dependent receptor